MHTCKMTTSHIPEPYTIDWTELIALWSFLATFSGVCIVWIRSHFKDKKTEKETFIKNVVQSAMSGTLDEVNGKIDKLFEYREKDKDNFDRKFDTIMREIKK